jgi:hypothetical protein
MTAIRVEVREDVETLHTSVSRVVWDDYYELPEELVTAVEDAQARLDAATKALIDYIETNGLEAQYVSEDET